jgi:hypothetical protein
MDSADEMAVLRDVLKNELLVYLNSCTPLPSPVKPLLAVFWKSTTPPESFREGV